MSRLCLPHQLLSWYADTVATVALTHIVCFNLHLYPQCSRLIPAPQSLVLHISMVQGLRGCVDQGLCGLTPIKTLLYSSIDFEILEAADFFLGVKQLLTFLLSFS